MLISPIDKSRSYSTPHLANIRNNSQNFKGTTNAAITECKNGHMDYFYKIGTACLAAAKPERLEQDSKEAVVKVALQIAQATGMAFDVGGKNTYAKIVKEDGVSNLALFRKKDDALLSKIAFSSFTYQPFSHTEYGNDGSVARKTGFGQDGKVSFIQEYENGELVNKTRYESDGKTDYVVEYKDGKVTEKRAYRETPNSDVEFLIRYENGLAVSSNGFRKDGETIDFFVEFDENGIPKFAAGDNQHSCYPEWIADDFGDNSDGSGFNKIEAFNMAGKALPEIPEKTMNRISRWTRVFND